MRLSGRQFIFAAAKKRLKTLKVSALCFRKGRNKVRKTFFDRLNLLFLSAQKAAYLLENVYFSARDGFQSSIH